MMNGIIVSSSEFSFWLDSVLPSVNSAQNYSVAWRDLFSTTSTIPGAYISLSSWKTKFMLN